MIDARALEAIWYGTRAPGIGLRALAALYGAVIGLRRGLYKAGILPRRKLPVPVIVVGNISVGGTGKTPLVIALVEALRTRGFTPGVISRGYGGTAKDAVMVDAQSDPGVVGDEARLVCDATSAPLCVARNRVMAGNTLLAHAAGVDVIIADDGLQHYPLCSNVEICVIDGARRFGNAKLLPAGPLREPVSRLDEVDFLVCNGGAVRAQDIAMTLHGDSAVALADAQQRRPLQEFAGRRVHAVAGIGNPQRFFAQLRAAGLELIEHPFPDHHRFVAADIQFDDHNDVVMTEKDAVKCRGFATARHWQLPARAQLPQSFFDAVAARLKNISRSD